MYLSKEKFNELVKRHPTTLIVPDDIIEAFDFVREVLEAESYALKKAEPYASKSINDLNSASYEVFSLSVDIGNEHFSEAG